MATHIYIWEVCLVGIKKLWKNFDHPMLKFYSDEYIATENQTVFELKSGEYGVGLNMMDVLLNGISQPNSFFVETDKTTVTFKAGVPAGTKVRLKYSNYQL